MILFSDIPYTKYAWEINIFHKYRELSDGLSFVELNIGYDKYMADHNPRFGIMFALCNYIILEFSVYNMYHVDTE